MVVLKFFTLIAYAVFVLYCSQLLGALGQPYESTPTTTEIDNSTEDYQNVEAHDYGNSSLECGAPDGAAAASGSDCDAMDTINPRPAFHPTDNGQDWGQGHHHLEVGAHADYPEHYSDQDQDQGPGPPQEEVGAYANCSAQPPAHGHFYSGWNSILLEGEWEAFSEEEDDVGPDIDFHPDQGGVEDQDQGPGPPQEEVGAYANWSAQPPAHGHFYSDWNINLREGEWEAFSEEEDDVGPDIDLHPDQGGVGDKDQGPGPPQEEVGAYANCSAHPPAHGHLYYDLNINLLEGELEASSEDEEEEDDVGPDIDLHPDQGGVEDSYTESVAAVQSTTTAPLLQKSDFR